MKIRPYRPDDLADIVALWRACALTTPYNDPAEDIAFCRGSPHSALLVGEVDRKPVATAMVGHDGHRGYVYYLAVAPDRRSQGLGRQIMAAAEDWLRARGVPKLNIIIRETNADVQRFYERLGFAVTPRLMMGKFLDPKAAGTGGDGGEGGDGGAGRDGGRHDGAED